MPFFDNNVLQCFGAARALPLLRRFRPARVTRRVADEQIRTAPEHARRQFEDALGKGWMTLHAPAARNDIISLQEAVRASAPPTRNCCCSRRRRARTSSPTRTCSRGPRRRAASS